MEDSSQKASPIDIVDEAYRGPPPSVVVLGTGAIKHLKWALIGLLGGFAGAFVFHDFSARTIHTFRERAEILSERANSGKFFHDLGARLQRGVGATLFALFGEGKHIESIQVVPQNPRHIDWVNTTLTNKQHGFGYWFPSHTLGLLPLIGKPVKNFLVKMGNGQHERVSDAITLGGITGALGYVSGWAMALFKGVHEGNAYKDQYDRFRAALIDARSKNQSQSTTSIPLESVAAISSEHTSDISVKKPPQPERLTPLEMAPVAADTGVQHSQAKSTIDAASIHHAGIQRAHHQAAV
ncbi:MAG: hypothetical protein B7X02_00105 [Rhodospirillales bacterium 12-54-5]|nr:MAG: hypothetical protein B7X02_00105 [Rhodospirillales bacterium 12-54-5]